MAPEVEKVYPDCPECEPGKIELTGDRDALICTNCRTVFVPFGRSRLD